MGYESMDSEEYFLLRCDRTVCYKYQHFGETVIFLFFRAQEIVYSKNGDSAFHGNATFLLDYMASHP
jgi:hypothetical protein